MAFTVQNDSGSQSGANAYIDDDFFREYHTDRCNSIRAYGNTEIRAAIIRATDYLDQRFRFIGEKQNGQSQTTSWPRLDAEDFDGVLRTGIPVEVEEATAEYALVALQNGFATSLNPAPDRDATGQAVKRKRTKVDVIEKDTEYTDAATWRMPKYPDADRKLQAAGLVISGRESRRA